MIAISITVHENPRVLMELLSNIKKCYNGNAFLVVHVSRNNKEAFYRHAVATNISLVDDQIYWNDQEINTKWGNTLPMLVSNYLYLKCKLTVPFDYFQVLSPANLIIKRDMDLYISSYDVVMRNATSTKNGWAWHDHAARDVKYEAFRCENSIEQMLCARVDGLAVRDTIFGDFVRQILKIYSIRDMQNIDPTYPQEETILPSYIKTLQNQSYRFGESCAKTFEPNEPQLTVEIVQKLITAGKVAYLKRIAAQADNDVRRFILQNFSLG